MHLALMHGIVQTNILATVKSVMQIIVCLARALAAHLVSINLHLLYRMRTREKWIIASLQQKLHFGSIGRLISL